MLSLQPPTSDCQLAIVRKGGALGPKESEVGDLTNHEIYGHHDHLAQPESIHEKALAAKPGLEKNARDWTR